MHEQIHEALTHELLARHVAVGEVHDALEHTGHHDHVAGRLHGRLPRLLREATEDVAGEAVAHGLDGLTRHDRRHPEALDDVVLEQFGDVPVGARRHRSPLVVADGGDCLTEAFGCCIVEIDDIGHGSRHYRARRPSRSCRDHVVSA